MVCDRVCDCLRFGNAETSEIPQQIATRVSSNDRFQLAICDAKTFLQKMIVFFTADPWHLSTAIAIVVFFIAVGLRFYASTLAVARILYACDLVFWYVRLLDIASVNHKLGPYITMIAKMVSTLSMPARYT